MINFLQIRYETMLFSFLEKQDCSLWSQERGNRKGWQTCVINVSCLSNIFLDKWLEKPNFKLIKSLTHKIQGTDYKRLNKLILSWANTYSEMVAYEHAKRARWAWLD
jgi:hypothetical protein